MFIKSLSLKDFRNYNKISLSPQNGLNILYGKNAQGKTNLVEAIYYLSTGKSFRTNRDGQMISFEKDAAYINAGFNTRAGSNTMNAILKKDGTKSFTINAMPIKKIGHLFGHFSCIAFTPEDIKAVKEAPALRRRLIDMEISKIKPAYFFDLKSYYQILAEKNALLKRKIGIDEKRLIGVYNEQLAKHAKSIIHLRQAFLTEMKPSFDKTYRFISGEDKTAIINYHSSVEPKNIEQAFLDKVNSLMTREIEYKQ
ncbi:MAG: DNA replication and repair protein RecF, partial [Eubacteriales bacterium]